METYFLQVTDAGILRRRFDGVDPEELPKLIGDQTGYGSVEIVEGCLLDGYASVLCDDEFAKMPWPVTAVIDGYEYRGALVVLRITRPFAFGPEKSEGIPVDRCDEIERLITLPISSHDSEECNSTVIDARDGALFAQIAQGDDAAFGQLIEKYQKAIRDSITKVLGDQMEAQDITQEVFLRVRQSAGSYCGKVNLSTLMFVIARELAFKEKDRRRSQGI